MSEIIPIEQESEESNIDKEGPSNSKLEEKLMDTHAHHLHHAPGKKIWHYLFEFIMLFLAVTCGFFVENLREYGVERKKERQYITSLIRDLEKDSAQYDFLNAYYRNKIIRLDSVISILTSPAFFHHPESIFKFNGDLNFYFDFIYTDGTMQQLKNAGGLRLIEKQNVVDSIITYDSYVRYSLRQQDGLQQTQNKNNELAINLLNFSYNDQKEINNENNPVLLTSSWKDILVFSGQISEYRNECSVLHDDLITNMTEAVRLLKILREEYH